MSKIIDDICTLMYPGALYPANVLKNIYIETYGIEGADTVDKSLSNECRKKVSKIQKVTTPDGNSYRLNPDIDFGDIKSINSTENIYRLANTIYKVIQARTVENLNRWLNEDLEQKLELIVTEKVEHEMTTEVVPLLSQYLEARKLESVKMTKASFKKHILSLISDVINTTDDEIGG